ncbi:transcription factor Opi1-domain-containing protein [Aspergillus multicolor]|uniref:putative clock controled protein (Ccg-8) n=1 Tax=Aspergillus multicolor TaxID=41759 RepID=UPI003CCCEE91
MDRSSDGIASLNSHLSSVTVRDATANPPTSVTTTNSYSDHPSPTPRAPFSHPSKPQHVSAIMEPDNITVAEDRSRRATSVLSMDDLEAAQALEGLRTDFGASPRASQQTAASPDPKSQEPILSLLTSTHPLISSAINGSVAAYTSSKSYSPRFKTGAEFIERNIGSPVASTVHTVGRKTGVEDSLRWALQRHASNSSESGRSKRRKVNGNSNSNPADRDLEIGLSTMDANNPPETPDLYLNESLPPYDDHKSPNYEEVGREGSPRQSTWQSRLMISTSGLGVAMSEESLKSLQYCLTWLRWANGRLGKSIVALQESLKEWESLPQKNGEAANGQASSQTLLSQRIQALKQDVLATLKQVVDVVSKYAGGALPENARNLVRRHLTSLPQRFRIASTAVPAPDGAGPSSEPSSSARRILVLAQEGLDMMSQVSGVVNETLVSAEHWCERLGRKRRGSKNADAKNADAKDPETQPVAQEYPADIKQPVADVHQDTPMTGLEQV